MMAGGCVAKLSCAGFGAEVGAHQLGKLGLHHAHQRLAGRERADDFLAQRLFLDPGDEFAHGGEGNVGLQQRQTHFAQHVGGVGFGQAGFAAHGLDHFGKTLGQVVKHGIGSVWSGEGRAGKRRQTCILPDAGQSPIAAFGTVGGRVTWCKLARCKTLFFYLAALIYATCAFLPARHRTAISAGTLAGWLVHGGALWADMVLPGSLRLGFAVVLSATLWISVAAYWLENRNFSLDSLRVLVLPCAAVAVVLPALFPGSLVPLQGRPVLYGWHIAVAIMAYSSLTIAAFHAVLMAVQEAQPAYARRAAALGWFAAMIERLPALADHGEAAVSPDRLRLRRC